MLIRFTCILFLIIGISCQSKRDRILSRLGNGVDTLVEENSLVESTILGRGDRDFLSFRQKILDERGRVIQERIVDAEGYLIINAYSPSVTEYQYDENGNLIGKLYKNGNGELLNDSDGLAVTKYHYDERGNLIRQEYYDRDLNLISLQGGAAIIINGYDSKNRRIETKYLNPNENLRSKAGRVSITYDDQDRVLHETIFDFEGGKEKVFYYIDFEYAENSVIEKRTKPNGDIIKIFQKTEDAVFEILERTDSTMTKQFIRKR